MSNTNINDVYWFYVPSRDSYDALVKWNEEMKGDVDIES